jgi:hypothetical protein
MSRIFKKLALLVAMVSCRLANAQGEVEAFRYSSSEPGMSARSMGMSGAFSSVGADVTSFYTNPAGLAVYKRTNAELAISNVSQTTTTTFDEVQKRDLRSRLSIGNFAFVKTQTPRSSRFTNLSYGIATAKTNHFYQNFTLEGKNDASLMEQFAWQAQGVNPVDVYNTLPFTSGLAYETYAIDPTDLVGTD